MRIAYDSDDAGDRAAARDAARFQAIGLECHRIKFPLGEDANSFALSEGGEALRKAVRSAQWLNAAPSTNGANGGSTSTPSSLAANVSSPDAAKKESVALVQRGEHWHATLGERAYRIGGLEKNGSLEVMKITLRLAAADALHVDQIDLCRDPDRRRFIERAAEETRLDAELIKRDLAELLLALETLQEERLAATLESATVDAPAMSQAERDEALALLRSDNLPGAIAEAFEACGIAGEDTNKLTAYLACTSRLLQRPLAVIIQSTSAAGKSTLMEAVLACFPSEAQIKYSAMTGQSLYYLGETNLAHKILAIVEEEGAEKASYALKLLQSEGELTIASTGKDPHTGRMKTEECHVKGPVMIFLTTTAIDIDEELMNRCLVLTVDESRAQTERIHDLQRKARTLEGLLAREERKETLRTLQNAQRLLKPYAIVNEFAAELTFTAEKTRSRRDHEKYLTLIDAITLLHQHQREVETRTIRGREIAFIRATRADIALANELAPEVLGRSLDELPPQTRRLLEAVKAIVRELPKGPKAFTRRTVREKTGWSATQVKLHLDRLAELEYVGTRYARAGTAMHYELLIDAHEPEGIAHVGLLEPAKLAAV